MRRHQFLHQLHRLVAPRNYLEIGVSTGSSVTISRVPTIAIDPAFQVVHPIRCDIQLARTTSDDFFDDEDPLRHLKSGRNPFKNFWRGRALFAHYRGGTKLDLALIDGMHLLEFSLRDFINVERFSDWNSVIVLDDMLPRNTDEAARDRHTEAWAGDVFQLKAILKQYRPELTLIPVNTEPTGVLLILGADSENLTLSNHYDDIISKWIQPDPQSVPQEILNRNDAIAPEALLSAPFWAQLVRSRNRRVKRARGYEKLRQQISILNSAL